MTCGGTFPIVCVVAQTATTLTSHKIISRQAAPSFAKSIALASLTVLQTIQQRGNGFFPGGNPSSSTLQNPSDICYNLPGTYDVTLITTGANGNDTLTLHNYITVFATPPFPTISQVGYTLTSSTADSYQWQLNGTDIPGATNQSYDILQSGLYTVVVGDSNSCKNSFSLYVLISGINDVMSDGNISISPNPSNGNFTVEFIGQTDNVSINIVNTVGQIIFSSAESRSTGTSPFKKEIDLRGDAMRGVAAGVYIVEIKTKDVLLRKKIVIE